MRFSCSVDDGFPVVKFNFKNSVVLNAYPHEYMFRLKASVLDSRTKVNYLDLVP